MNAYTVVNSKLPTPESVNGPFEIVFVGKNLKVFAGRYNPDNGHIEAVWETNEKPVTDELLEWDKFRSTYSQHAINKEGWLTIVLCILAALVVGSILRMSSFDIREVLHQSNFAMQVSFILYVICTSALFAIAWVEGTMLKGWHKFFAFPASLLIVLASVACLLY